MNEIGPIESVRREPTQKRSRERVERILSCASTLIEKSGSDAMRMSQRGGDGGHWDPFAGRQYFPDKGAIIRTLAERYNVLGQQCIAEGLQDVLGREGLRRAFGELIDVYYAMFLAEPVMRDIWSGTQADKALRDISLADSRINGAVSGGGAGARRSQGGPQCTGGVELSDHAARRGDDAPCDLG